jgi:hypothetical protein
MIPSAFIVKCSTDAADQRNVRVIATLASKVLTIGKGWSAVKMWAAELDVTGKGLCQYYRPYLEHRVSHDIVFAQVNAYNDAVGMIM